MTENALEGGSLKAEAGKGTMALMKAAGERQSYGRTRGHLNRREGDQEVSS